MEPSLQSYSTRVQVVGICTNITLSLFKLAAGILARSGAMISDAAHSISDIFSDLVVFVGIRISYRASDPDHQYGHERMESICAVILAMILALVGAGIGLEGARKILQGMEGALEAPGGLALVAAVVSIVAKEWLFRYTRTAARRIGSDALMANAWHHRSDALSSIGSFAGILGAKLGYPILDPVASVVICLFILKAAWDIYRDAVRKLVDRSCDPDTEEQIRQVILAQEGVLGLDELKTRLFGSRIYVDIAIACDGDLSLTDAHAIAERVHRQVEDQFPDVKHCMIHVNPAGGDGEKEDDEIPFPSHPASQ